MLLMAIAAMLCTCDLGEKFAEKSAWQESSTAFVSVHAEDGFKFASQKRDVVNCLLRGGSSWHGLSAYESRIYYGEEGPERVEISLYNRGDDKSGIPMSDDDLKFFLKTIASKIEPDGELGNPERRKLKTGGMAYCRRWNDLDPSVELSWGVSGSSSKTRTAEYVRLVLTPKKALAKPSTRAESGPDARTKAQSNVSKGPGGDVWIKGVPMVDQGEKGYCAVATTERVMRYYGIAVDEHELAHMAKSSAEGGTSVSAMIDVVKMVGSKHRLGYSEIVRMTKSVDDVVREVKAYNKVAKVEKGEQISVDAHTVNRRIDTTSLREAMDPEILRKMRVKDGRYRKFLSEVKTQVDKGVPVFWGVTLGIYRESDLPQSAGGHLRLIIGYNAETKDILFTDSWGARHELKRMPEDWAFAITHSAFYLKPL